MITNSYLCIRQDIDFCQASKSRLDAIVIFLDDIRVLGHKDEDDEVGTIHKDYATLLVRIIALCFILLSMLSDSKSSKNLQEVSELFVELAPSSNPSNRLWVIYGPKTCLFVFIRGFVILFWDGFQNHFYHCYSWLLDKGLWKNATFSKQLLQKINSNFAVPQN